VPTVSMNNGQESYRGVFGDYLGSLESFEALTAERKKQLAEISKRRDAMSWSLPLILQVVGAESINYSDLLPINDSWRTCTGTNSI